MRELITSPEVVKPAANISFYGGALLSIISGLSLSDWGVIMGILMTVAGGYMRWREYQFKKKEHQLLQKKSEAELLEIKSRVVFMERAGLTPMQYHQPPAKLEEMKEPKNEQKA